MVSTGRYFLFNGLFFVSGGRWFYWFAPALAAALIVVCVARFGLFAACSFFVFFFLTFHNPITSKISIWYFGNTIFAAVVLLGLAIYGFYLSLAGQPIFSAELFEENADDPLQ